MCINKGAQINASPLVCHIKVLICEHCKELILGDDGYAELSGFFELCRTHILAGKNKIGLR